MCSMEQLVVGWDFCLKALTAFDKQKTHTQPNSQLPSAHLGLLSRTVLLMGVAALCNTELHHAQPWCPNGLCWINYPLTSK